MSQQPQSGLEYLRGMVGQNAAPYGRLLDFRLIEVEEGEALFEAAPHGDHYNPHGVVHGGYAASLLDSAMGCSVQTKLAPGTKYTTIELKINFVRAMTETTGRITARGSVIHAGRRLATAEGRIEDGQGRLIAHGTTTCMILEAPGEDA